MRYIIDDSYRRKEKLIVTSIDFAKAFDSINRGSLIKALMKYNIHPKLINIIANIYSEDATNIYFNGTKQAEMEITNGIRQGCNGSTILFLIITFVIIERLEKENIGYENEKFKYL